MSNLNQEREPVIFVWERTRHSTKPFNAALYRGEYMTPDSAKRIVFKHVLDRIEEQMTLNQLITKYPLPNEARIKE